MEIDIKTSVEWRQTRRRPRCRLLKTTLHIKELKPVRNWNHFIYWLTDDKVILCVQLARSPGPDWAPCHWWRMVTSTAGHTDHWLSGTRLHLSARCMSMSNVILEIIVIKFNQAKQDKAFGLSKKIINDIMWVCLKYALLKFKHSFLKYVFRCIIYPHQIIL